MEPSDRSLLRNKPRDPKKGFLNRGFATLLLAYALPIAAVTMVAFYLGFRESAMYASTCAFATLTLARLFHGFNCRSDKSIFAIKFTSNTWSIWAFLAGVVLLALVMVVPVLSRLFSVAAVDRSQLLSILGLAFLPTLVIQMVKAIRDKVRG